MNQKLPPSILEAQFTEIRRKMVLELAGGDHRCLPLIHSLERLRHREAIYRWLLRNDIKGEKLFTFFEERGFSWNRVAKEVISRIEKQDRRPLIAGKDVL